MENQNQQTPPSDISPADPVESYARAVVAGEIVAGRLVRLACKRHLDDLEGGSDRGLAWDLVAAERAIGFFPDVLRLAEGEHAGQPFVLQPAQQFIVGSLFGWKGPDGYRRFRTAYVEIGKGNGKSPLAGGLGLYMMVGDGETGAHCFAAAVTQDQAKILFRDAENMVDTSPQLQKRLTKTVNNIAHMPSGSYFRPVSSEGRGLDGKRVHYAAIDEVHEHPTAIVVDKMRAGTKGRRQALILEITNSGYDRNSVCWQHHEYSRRILEGLDHNDTWFSYVCGLDDGDDYRDEAVWLKANPLLGVSVPVKYLREQVAEAKGMPSKESIVRRLNFCEWTEADSPWISVEQWNASLADIDLTAFEKRRCYLSLDLSGKNDLTALGFTFPDDDGGVDCFVQYWTPQDSMREREDREHVPYSVWKRDGFIESVPGRSIDYGFIASAIREAVERFNVVELSYDRWRIDDLLRELDEADVPSYVEGSKDYPRGLKLVPFGQGFKDMGPAVDALETAILNKHARIKRNPVTTMCSLNAVLEMDPAGSRKFTKRKSLGRIDGIVVLAMGVKRAANNAIPIPASGVTVLD